MKKRILNHAWLNGWDRPGRREPVDIHGNQIRVHPWVSMDIQWFHRYPYFFEDIHGYPWDPIVPPGIPGNPDTHRIPGKPGSRDIRGYTWMSMHIFGILGIPNLHGYLWESQTSQGTPLVFQGTLIYMDIWAHPIRAMDIWAYPWISIDIHGARTDNLKSNTHYDTSFSSTEEVALRIIIFWGRQSD